MQRRVTLEGKELSQKGNKLDRLLEKGWKVVQPPCSFSEYVSVDYGGGYTSEGSIGFVGHKVSGRYGVVFIVEKKTDEDEDEDEDEYEE